MEARHSLRRAALALLALLLAGSSGAGSSGGVAPSAELVAPIDVGTRIPDATVRTVGGDETSLDALTGDAIVALVFYRGGW